MVCHPTPPHLRLDDCVFHVLHAVQDHAFATVQVAHGRPLEFHRHGDLHPHDGLQDDGAGVLVGLAEALDGGQLEGHLIGVDRVGAAVRQNNPHTLRSSVGARLMQVAGDVEAKGVCCYLCCGVGTGASGWQANNCGEIKSVCRLQKRQARGRK